MKLRDYQTEVLQRARERIRQGGRRGIIQGETGCGKGVIIGELCRCAAEKGTRTLVLADRRRLVHQIGGTLEEMGVRYGKIMAGETGGTLETIVCASRDTLASWMENETREIPPFDCVLVDEGHKSPGATYQSIINLFPRAFVIAFSGTPARNDGKSLGDFFQWIECTVPASKLIREGWLIKPEVYAPLELAKRRKKGEGKGLAGDPVSHWKQHAADLPTIAFASKVSESIALRDRFLASNIAAEHIDASANDAEREAKFKRLQTGETKVLCSVQLLIEGVDIPEVSAAILWSKFGSMVQYRQACGRTMRPAPWINKTRSVILDHAGAAGVHGLPGEDVDWSLDLSSTVGSRRDAAIKDGRQQSTVFCQACGAAFTGSPACPACGWVVPRERKKRTMAEAFDSARDEILSRFTPEVADERVKELRLAAWHKCIYTAIGKGGTAGMAAKMFERQCKKTPWDAGVYPLPESRGGWRLAAQDVWPTFVRRATA